MIFGSGGPEGRQGFTMRRRYNILKQLVDIFSTSILIEALAPSKLSTVSGYKSVKELSLVSFAYTPHLIKEPLEGVVKDALGNRGFRLGPSLRKYVLNAINHPLVRTNTAFGYVMLAAPLVYILVKACQTDSRLGLVESLIERYMPSVVEGLKKEPCTDFYTALRKASMSHMGEYFGTIPSATSADRGTLRKTSLWKVLRDSMHMDLVSHEIVTGFKRVLKVCRYLRDEVPEGDLLQRVSSVHAEVLKEHVDTLVLKSRCLNTALLVKYLSLARPYLNDGVWETLDAHVRRYGINPGTTSDIVAAGLALYQVTAYIIEDPQR